MTFGICRPSESRNTVHVLANPREIHADKRSHFHLRRHHRLHGSLRCKPSQLRNYCQNYTDIEQPFFYIQYFAESNQIARGELAFYLLAILNAGSIFGRIIPNFIAGKLGPMNMLVFCVVVTSILVWTLLSVHNLAGELSPSSKQRLHRAVLCATNTVRRHRLRPLLRLLLRHLRLAAADRLHPAHERQGQDWHPAGYGLWLNFSGRARWYAYRGRNSPTARLRRRMVLFGSDYDSLRRFGGRGEVL